MAEALAHIPEQISQIQLKLTLTGRRRAAVRMWLGSHIILLAVMVIGCGIEIVDETEA